MRSAASYCVAVLLLVASGCVLFNPGRTQTGAASRAPLSSGAATAVAEPKTSNLPVGATCEIEMTVPPTAVQGSYQRFVGTVAEVTPEDVALTDTVEEGWLEYGTSMKRRDPYSKQRGPVRVPTTCIASVKVLSLPPKAETAAKSASVERRQPSTNPAAERGQ